MELFKSRPRVVYTNAVGDKVYPVVVDIKKGIKSTEDIQFVSSDVNTGILSVAFIQGNDNYNVTGADVVCSVMRPDASTLELPCEVVGENIVEVPLGINGTSQDGVYSFDFKVFKGENKVVGTPIMNYSVSLSIDNDMVVEEDDRLPVLTVLMTQLTELKGEARESINQANTATVASREATAKAIEATNNANAVSERVSQETSEVISRVDNKVNEVETRFNALTTSQQQDAEVIDARDGETSLKARLDRDIEKAKQVYVELEGSYISTESSTGAIQDLEILGNTVQDPNNLADIKSVGELQEDGTYKMSILSCGKNLFDGIYENNKTLDNNGTLSTFTNRGVSNYIKIKPNTNYIGFENFFRVCFYDEDKNFISLSDENNKIRVTPNNAKYIRFVFTTSNFNSIQIEEGTQATPYEPYQENKCDILLPCQLEKVGDVADRIICKDGVWGVEKNIGNYIFDTSLLNLTFSTGSKNIQYYAENILPNALKDIYSVNNINSFCPSINRDNRETCTTVSCWNTTLIAFAMPKDMYPTITDFKNNIPKEIEFRYMLAEPQFIPLPRNTQIQLNSFFGTTHIYMESGEVEGTIKCKIPKSLGATVQSLNNKTDILSDRIEAIEGLKDSQNMKYETDKGYLVCKETKNGVIDDMKIKGKTLVNLCPKYVKNSDLWVNKTFESDSDGFVTVNANGTWLACPRLKMSSTNVKPNTVYTLILDVKLNTLNSSNGNGFEFVSSAWSGFAFKVNIHVAPNKTGRFIHKITSVNDFENVNELFRSQLYNTCTSGTIVYRWYLLEGDHTQNPPSYFEGLMSVGQDVDEIVVESVKGDGNLISSECKVGTMFEVYVPKGEYVASCKSKQCTIRFYRKDKTLIDYWSLNGEETIYRSFVVLEDIYYVLFDGDINTTDIQLIKGNTPRQYTPRQSDKKQILFYNSNGELEPVQELHEWDSIEKHSDNKWYYHKRSGKVVLNGSENWSLPTLETGQVDTNWETETHIAFRTSGLINPKEVFWGHQQTCICNRFKVSILNNTTYTLSDEFIGQNSLGLDIKISKSKLSTQDVEGFKQWLQANNVTVVYQLAQEEVYELTPLHLDSYANETLILCNSGAISPKMEFSITSHINELVKSQGDRISLLEEKMYKALKQVLAGDMYSLAELLYPEDFVEENPENEIMLLPFE